MTQTLDYRVMRNGEIESDTVTGVRSISWNRDANYLVVDYFDGEFNHTRNIPLGILVTFWLR